MSAPLKVTVEDILATATVFPDKREWTLQGFGMLRTYLDVDKTWRLHVWDDRYQVEDVSLIHTHPWDFTSYVIAGQVTNDILWELRPEHYGTDAANTESPMLRQKIRCGEGGGLEGKPFPCRLGIGSSTVYQEGMRYHQRYDQIHVSQPLPGTVTLVERRVPPGGSPDHAFVYFNRLTGWVSAEPRRAEPDEVKQILRRSLMRWFK